MSLEIEQHGRDGVVILALKGRIVLGDELEKFRTAMDDLLVAGQTRVAVDLREVDYIDSSGLGCLVMQHTRTVKAEGVMVLFGLRRRQIELMVITKLATVFVLAETEMDAVNVCFPDRDAKPFDILNFVASQKKDGGTA
jgi:anti-sigma B factor antagonist